MTETRYFSIHRPVAPGTFPRAEKVVDIVNFDSRVYCEEIGREAWGYIVYRNPITEEDASRYELVREEKNEGDVIVAWEDPEDADNVLYSRVCGEIEKRDGFWRFAGVLHDSPCPLPEEHCIPEEKVYGTLAGDNPYKA